MSTQLDNKYRKLLQGVNTLAITCNQWGDTGKGKFVDLIAHEWADINARGTGGANAGHTIHLGKKEYVFHLVPSAILHDGLGKINIIGSGVAFDPGVIHHELQLLQKAFLGYNHLMFSKDAKLVLPQHLVLDRAREKLAAGKIGTTGRGIGPVYSDYINRRGLTLNDILNTDVFARKLQVNLQEKVPTLKAFDPQIIKDIMHHDHLHCGRFWSASYMFDIDAIIETYQRYASEFKDMIRDTDEFLRSAVGRKKILLEGAQGLLLSISKGSYPYVTASDCSKAGLADGVGLRESNIDLTLGIVKFPYMTRVGGGPFPTELGGAKSAQWCADPHVNKKYELTTHGTSSVNTGDEFEQGIGIRMKGNEYGATTGRARRTGWIDLPLLRYAIRQNGRDVILTKPDVLDECEVIRVCVAYEYQGEPYQLGERFLRKGTRLEVASMDYEVLKNCKPVFRDFPGWMTSIREIRSFDQLPEKLKNIIIFTENNTGMKTRIVSVGADRDDTIVVTE